MDTQVLYNIFHQEAFGFNIAMYFYLTGLSAGSFILSTLAYGFGMNQYKPLGRVGVILATLLLVIAPFFLLIHIGMPLRAWHLFVYLNWSSPITWGSFLLILYPINCIIYGYFMFKEKMKPTRIFGLIGIPLAIAVHGYTGFILAFGKARALWNTALMPILFLASAIVSGIALMILVVILKDRFFSKEKRIDRDLIMNLGKLLAWMIVFDLFLVGSDLLVLLISHSDAQAAAYLILGGKFSVMFLIIENLLGKIIPFILLAVPKFRTLPTVIAASILVVVGIFFMRYVVVVAGEFIPLL
ncbi:MAG: polysulfide reductase NrfD [Candidatus Aminicenantes bacterium]|nr:polysulfide reductase NrfD [Candidatus Aminicenantes bacterium]MDH5467950.1 polysulfide reductase NrfD [Candidatus Aminicenantes bacterium]MDH5705639.1 polysulfide reductase NrfD [Candidatus Aminicenantes bacterium]